MNLCGNLQIIDPTNTVYVPECRLSSQWNCAGDEMRPSATRHHTLQHTATHCNIHDKHMMRMRAMRRGSSATHCTTLQYTASHCNILQYSATHCVTLQHTTSHYKTLQHTATHCNLHNRNMMRMRATRRGSSATRTATHCGTLQCTATPPGRFVHEGHTVKVTR